MQQRGTGPDAVILVLVLDILQALHLDGFPNPIFRQGGDLGGGVEGGDFVAAFDEVPGVATRAAAHIQDVSSLWQQRKEALVERLHVDLEGRFNEGLGVIIVVAHTISKISVATVPPF